jgi:hypothetical protein
MFSGYNYSMVLRWVVGGACSISWFSPSISCVFNHKLAFSLSGGWDLSAWICQHGLFSRSLFLGRMEDGYAGLELAVSLLRMSCHLNFRGSFQS